MMSLILDESAVRSPTPRLSFSFSLSFSQLDSCKVKLHEQERKISDLERQVLNQRITIKLMQTEKEHGLVLNQHGQELANQITPRTPYMHRPHSAESARKPNYRISESSKMLRGGVGGRNTIIHQESEFSIPLPAQNSSQGARVDILNLEEQPERRRKQVIMLFLFCNGY